MNLETKRRLIITLAIAFLVSLIFVQWMEVLRKQQESSRRSDHVSVPESSKKCAECHAQSNPGIVAQWKGSTHAAKGVACVECHQAQDGEPDAFKHYGVTIATVVSPLDCARCHAEVQKEFAQSHHAAGGNILASLDNFLAETVEGARMPFQPHAPTPGFNVEQVNGMASANSGCQQCHGAKVALQANDGSSLTFEDFQPGPDGKPTNQAAMAKIKRDQDGKPTYVASTWPNTGIGRLNLDGSRGSCSACHSRHDFSPRRARRPENCGKCHLGPDHPQKEIYEESKHGVAYRDMEDQMNLDAPDWVLGEDYTAAPTCATCHMSANTRNGKKITHDPRTRISWNNRPPISIRLDTDLNGHEVKATDPAERQKLVVDTADQKRARMKDVCGHCHTPDYINSFYKQYDDLVVLYNEKFAKPGTTLMNALSAQGMLTKAQFDEEIEWTWFYLWHHEGRRARHGASMMAPDYTHWHGMYEVSERFYDQLIPQAKTLVAEARVKGKNAEADAVAKVIDEIMAKPEHQWHAKAKEASAAPAPAGKGH